MPKTLILFAYAENFHSKARENLIYFLMNGIINDPDVQYLIIQNCPTMTVNIPGKYTNVSIIKSNIKGKAWGSWKRGLDSVNINDYTYFIFLKDTVKGPLLTENTEKSWYKQFTDLIDQTTKLVGLEFLILPSCYNGSWIKKGYATYLDNQNKYNTHIITSAWATDLKGLKMLLPIFTDTYKKKEFIVNQTIVKHGFNIKSLEKRFRHWDLRKRMNVDAAKKAYLEHYERELGLLFEWSKDRRAFIYPDNIAWP